MLTNSNSVYFYRRTLC